MGIIKMNYMGVVIMTDFSRLLRRRTIIAALCYFAVGLLFVCVPEITDKAIAILISLALLLFGAFKIVASFAHQSANVADRSSLPMGVILSLWALACLVKPALLISVVYALLGVAVVANGALKLQLGLELRRAGSPYWGSAAVASAAAIILGAIAILAPFRTAKTVTILVGISMLCCAAFDLVGAIFFIKPNNE